MYAFSLKTPLFRFTYRVLGCFAKHLTQFPFFPCGSNGKEFACNVGDLGSIPGLGRCLGGGHGNPLRYSCLENPRGQRSLADHSPLGHKESDTAKQLSIALTQFPFIIYEGILKNDVLEIGHLLNSIETIIIQFYSKANNSNKTKPNTY